MKIRLGKPTGKIHDMQVIINLKVLENKDQKNVILHPIKNLKL